MSVAHSGCCAAGEFSKGQFHGKGVLTFPNGGRFVGTWENGRAVDGQYEFVDSLSFEDDDEENEAAGSEAWSYCTPADRRFWSEQQRGSVFVVEPQLSNDDPAPPVPKGCFDVGEGYYDPSTGNVYSFGAGEYLRKVTAEEEAEWAKTKCRRGEEEEASVDE